MAHTISDPISNALYERYASNRSGFGRIAINIDHVFDAVDQPFTQSKTSREIFQIARRRHQYGITDPVELECDGRFDGNHPFDALKASTGFDTREGQGHVPVCIDFAYQGAILTGTDFAAGT